MHNKAAKPTAYPSAALQGELRLSGNVIRHESTHSILQGSKALNHPIRCQCGTLKGYVNHPENVNRGVCYCKDCQAFAHFLGADSEILDEMGGTDVIQTLPKNVNFAEGTETLACMRLTENGLLRWYTSCCNTPIGNTPANFKISFVGLVHNCLEDPEKSLGDSFGPIRMRVNTKSAKGKPKPKSVGMIATILRFVPMLTMVRIDGSYKHTPFFVVDSGTPIVTPKVLSRVELERVMNAVCQIAAPDSWLRSCFLRSQQARPSHSCR